MCGNEFASDVALSQHLKDKHSTTLEQAGKIDDQGEKREAKKGKSLRKKNRHPVLIGVILAGILLGGGLYYVVAPTFQPFPYPCGAEGTLFHIHPYLRIEITGQNVTIPSNIGECNGGTGLEPMHVHDSSGIIHIESDANRIFTLGAFFDIWAINDPTITIAGVSHTVEFQTGNIFGMKTNSTGQVVLIVDGHNSSDWRTLDLDRLDYCSAATTGPPCLPTAAGDPYWNGASGSYPYGTGHTIVVKYCPGKCSIP